MTTPQARRERAERLAQEYFMQWGVIDTLPSLRDEDEELASRWLTDLLLTFAAQEAEQQCRYPDDPARSVAAMLSRMSPEDKQAFNFCVKAASAQTDQRVRALEGAD